MARKTAQIAKALNYSDDDFWMNVDRNIYGKWHKHPLLPLATAIKTARRQRITSEKAGMTDAAKAALKATEEMVKQKVDELLLGPLLKAETQMIRDLADMVQHLEKLDGKATDQERHLIQLHHERYRLDHGGENPTRPELFEILKTVDSVRFRPETERQFQRAAQGLPFKKAPMGRPKKKP